MLVWEEKRELEQQQESVATAWQSEDKGAGMEECSAVKFGEEVQCSGTASGTRCGE